MFCTCKRLTTLVSKLLPMNLNFSTLFLISVIAMFCLCCKDEDSSLTNDLIVFGSQANVGMTWKNGNQVPVTDGGKNSDVLAGLVSGSDTHLVGYQVTNGIRVAKYWKNGFETSLSDGSINEEATAIAISGTDIYIAGHERNSNGRFGIKYWKNGIPVILQKDMTFVFVTGIAIVGSDIYLTGIESKQDSVIGKYWKNGLARKVDQSAQISYAWGITSFENDVYIVGSSIKNGIEVAKYWKNGVENILTDGLSNAKATAITATNNGIYIGGDILRSPVYWVNGKLNTLNSLPNHTTDVNQIAVAREDIFVSALIYDSSGKTSSLIWKNGEWQEPFTGMNNEIKIEGLFIITR